MTNRTTLSLLVAIALATTTYLACDDGSSAVKESLPEGGAGGTIDPGQDGGDGGSKDCFDNPTTHFEIINACTNAAKIAKNPTLPKLLPDGGLPPLQ